MSTPIPPNLARFSWYAQHQAWLRSRGIKPRHDPGDAEPRRSDLTGADLTGANLAWGDLTGADLWGADLTRAVLTGAILTGANLAGATLPEAVPVVPYIDAAILARIEDGGGTLDMADWHTCASTHCRYGWAIHLAGVAGTALEDRLGPRAAGALIYAASRPDKPVPAYTGGNDEVLADIRACAKEQTA